MKQLQKIKAIASMSKHRPWRVAGLCLCALFGIWVAIQLKDKSSTLVGKENDEVARPAEELTLEVRQRRGKKAFDQASAEEQNARFDTAIEGFKRHLELEPQSRESRLRIAVCYTRIFAATQDDKYRKSAIAYLRAYLAMENEFCLDKRSSGWLQAREILESLLLPQLSGDEKKSFVEAKQLIEEAEQIRWAQPLITDPLKLEPYTTRLEAAQKLLAGLSSRGYLPARMYLGLIAERLGKFGAAYVDYAFCKAQWYAHLNVEMDKETADILRRGLTTCRSVYCKERRREQEAEGDRLMSESGNYNKAVCSYEEAVECLIEDQSVYEKTQFYHSWPDHGWPGLKDRVSDHALREKLERAYSCASRERFKLRDLKMPSIDIDESKVTVVEMRLKAERLKTDYRKSVALRSDLGRFIDLDRIDRLEKEVDASRKQENRLNGNPLNALLGAAEPAGPDHRKEMAALNNLIEALKDSIPSTYPSSDIADDNYRRSALYFATRPRRP